MFILLIQKKWDITVMRFSTIIRHQYTMSKNDPFSAFNLLIYNQQKIIVSIRTIRRVFFNYLAVLGETCEISLSDKNIKINALTPKKQSEFWVVMLQYGFFYANTGIFVATKHRSW